jgi:nitroreductase
VEDYLIVEKSARKPAAATAAVRHLELWGSLKLGPQVRHDMERELWSAAHPAAHNILVAVRAMGMGAVITMPMVPAPPGTCEGILAVPKAVELAAMIPVGYPEGRFGRVTRPPTESFISWDRYGSG